MGLSISYYTIDDEISGESSNGSRLDYLTDAIGSVTAKIDNAGAVFSSARYNPYGENLRGTTYIFGWAGSYGYRRAAIGHYIRARHYSEFEGSWTTTDKLWPDQHAFSYTTNPITSLDPSGLAPCEFLCIPGITLENLGSACSATRQYNKILKKYYYEIVIYKCMRITCNSSEGTGGCTLTQYVTGHFHNNKRVVWDKKHKQDGAPTAFSCGLSGIIIDAPGQHDGKHQVEGNRCSVGVLTIDEATLLKQLPWAWRAAFVDVCTCGAFTTKQWWNFNFDLVNDNGKVKCIPNPKT